ncbi:MAG: universal stress protein [Nocardioidaceae bacterium]
MLTAGNREVEVFKTIVVGVDGSGASLDALSHAVELARRDEARLVIAHVEERIAGKGGAFPVFADEQEVRADIRRRVDELRAEGLDASVETAVEVLGGPAHAIAEIAEKADADLIVVGTRGHSPVAGLLLGGVTQRLLHIAHRPVLAVPPSSR